MGSGCRAQSPELMYTARPVGPLHRPLHGDEGDLNGTASFPTKGMNATAAYKAAGYAAKRDRAVRAARLLTKNANVKTRVAELQRQAAAKAARHRRMDQPPSSTPFSGLGSTPSRPPHVSRK